MARYFFFSGHDAGAGGWSLPQNRRGKTPHAYIQQCFEICVEFFFCLYLIIAGIVCEESVRQVGDHE